MPRLISCSLLALAACTTTPPPVASTDPAAAGDLDRVLRAQTQEMLDAVAAGATKVWDRYLDPQKIGRAHV